MASTENSPMPDAPPAEKKRSLARAMIWRAVALVVTAIGLYAVWPEFMDVFSAWPSLRQLDPIWFVIMAAFETLSFACVWALTRLVLQRRGWFLSVTSQLAANALSRIVPGGAAAGGALQIQMLAQGGIDGARIATGMTAVSILTTFTVLALPILSMPAVLGGLEVQSGLLTAGLIGIAVFVSAAAVFALLLATDSPLLALGKATQRVRNWVRRKKPPMVGLDRRLQSERDLLRTVLGRGWLVALLCSLGKSFFDFFALLAALVAVGAQPTPSLVLLAYVVSVLLGMIPITPGGLGFVEAGLVAALGLAGVGAGEATAATLAYRLVSFWLPLPAGLLAYVAYQRRYGRPSDTVGGAASVQEEESALTPDA